MRIEQRVAFDHPPEKVWDHLVDLRVVAACIPGAVVTGVSDDGEHVGRLTIGLGSVTMSFDGVARFTSVDEAARRVVLRGEGRTSQGQVRLDLEGSVEPHDGGSAVVLRSDVVLSGRLAQFGQRLAGGVTEQVLEQFAANLSRRLEGGAPTIAERQDVLRVGSVVPEAVRDPRVLAGSALLLVAVAAWLVGRRLGVDRS